MKLKNSFNFECKCKWCIEPEKTKFDKKIKKYKKLDEQIPNLSMINPEKGYNFSLNILEIVKNNFNEIPLIMEKHYYDALQHAMSLNKYSDSIKLIKKIHIMVD